MQLQWLALVGAWMHGGYRLINHGAEDDVPWTDYGSKAPTSHRRRQQGSSIQSESELLGVDPTGVRLRRAHPDNDSLPDSAAAF
eukprot:355252-Chlamydomonas_euryale.AAC.4